MPESLAKAAGASAGDDSGATVEDVEDLVGEEAKLGIRKPASLAAQQESPAIQRTRLVRLLAADVAIPHAPFYGSRVVEDISLDDVFSFVNETALFKGQWQFKQGRKSPEEYEALVRDKVRPIYEELKERSKREQLLLPRVVYGYFPASVLRQ